jgi:hypothetical protein
MTDKAENRPILFHSMWRTSSTYFFTLFRERDEYLTYYEPFNEALISIEDALNQPDEPSHPTVKKPYFHEYQFAREGNKLKHFNLNFAYLQKLWFDFDSECKSYIDNLTQVAGSKNKTPFLQFNRSFLCMDHFKDFHSQALNVYFYRNPRSQFISYENAGKGYYIGLSYLQFASETCRNSSNAFRFINIPFYYSKISFQNTLGFYRAFADLGVVTSYYVFFSLWCIGLMSAIRLDLPCVNVNSQRSKHNLENGVLDFFEKEFPHLDLHDYNPVSYDPSRELSDTFLAVERLVISHLNESSYLPYIDELQTHLGSFHDNWTNNKKPQPGLLRKISEEVRLATNSNFANMANGLNLNLNGQR